MAGLYLPTPPLSLGKMGTVFPGHGVPREHLPSTLTSSHRCLSDPSREFDPKMDQTHPV